MIVQIVMRYILFILFTCLSVRVLAIDSELALTNKEFPRWIEAFKYSAKGPFNRIRWYCKDGAVLPPGAGACATHGGGIQHGQWNERTRMLRKAGYAVGNVLAAIEPQTLIGAGGDREDLKQILLDILNHQPNNIYHYHA